MSKTIQIGPGALETVPIGSIRPHPQNPNRNELPPLIDSIQKVGFYGAVTVQKSTGYIIAGNHRYMAAIASGMTSVPVIYLDVDDAEAKRLMLSDNRVAEDGAQDQQKLDELMSFWNTEAGQSAMGAAAPAPPAAPHTPGGYEDDGDDEGDGDDGEAPAERATREPTPPTPREYDPTGAKRIISVGYSLDDFDLVSAVLDKMRLDYGQAANGDALLVHLEQKYGAEVAR